MRTMCSNYFLMLQLILMCYFNLSHCSGDKNDTFMMTDSNLNLNNNNSLIVKVQNELSGEESRSDLIEETRKRKGQQQQGMMSNLLPMMIIPFMVSTGMIPMMLMSLKFMLLKSAFLGKIAIILMIINMFRPRNNGGGVFTHNLQQKDLAMEHYGYSGDEEYGAYVNKRRK